MLNETNKIMIATVSCTGKILVKTSKELKGRGIQKVSNGKYLLTDSAYARIQNQCTWANQDLS